MPFEGTSIIKKFFSMGCLTIPNILYFRGHFFGKVYSIRMISFGKVSILIYQLFGKLQYDR